MARSMGPNGQGIIVEDGKVDPLTGLTTFEGVYWLVAPASLVVPNETAVMPSWFPTVAQNANWGYTPAELAAIQAGTIVQVPFVLPNQASNVAAIAAAEGNFTNAQNQLNLQAPVTHDVGASWPGSGGVTINS